MIITESNKIFLLSLFENNNTFKTLDSGYKKLFKQKKGKLTDDEIKLLKPHLANHIEKTNRLIKQGVLLTLPVGAIAYGYKNGILDIQDNPYYTNTVGKFTNTFAGVSAMARLGGGSYAKYKFNKLTDEVNKQEKNK